MNGSRPDDWNAHRVACKGLSRQVGETTTSQERLLVEAGATAIIEAGWKKVPSTVWLLDKLLGVTVKLSFDAKRKIAAELHRAWLEDDTNDGLTDFIGDELPITHSDENIGREQ